MSSHSYGVIYLIAIKVFPAFRLSHSLLKRGIRQSRRTEVYWCPEGVSATQRDRGTVKFVCLISVLLAEVQPYHLYLSPFFLSVFLSPIQSVPFPPLS